MEETIVPGKDLPGEDAGSAVLPSEDRPARGPRGAGVFRHSVGAYAASMAICLGLVVVTFRLWQADLRVPLDSYWGDTVIYLALFKGVSENGWFLHNDALGAPTGLDMNDFPLTETWHFALTKLMGCAVSDSVIVYNVYYLLTFPLITLATLFVLRRLQIGRGPAVVASILYAFLPYHLHKFGHLFLSSYYLVPPMALVILQIYLGRFPFLTPAEGGTALPRRTAWLGMGGAILICVLTGLAQIYFAFFACFFLLIAGIASSYGRRKAAPLCIAAMLVAVIGLSVAAVLAPTFRYRAVHGFNPIAVTRVPGESDIYGLKISALLLPQSGHRLAYLANFKDQYNQTFAWTRLVNENDSASLGIVASFGFLWLLGHLLLRRGPGRPADLEDGLAVLSLSAVLLGTIGGLASLFSFISYFLLGFPALRSYTRVSVYIGFFAFTCVALLLDRLARRYVPAVVTRKAFLGILVIVLTVGVLDQTSDGRVPPYADIQQLYHSEAAFVAQLESELPPNAMIFQLPYRPFPETDVTGEDLDYDGFRLYLHSRTLRWSYGAMKGRGEDRWQREVAGWGAEKMAQAVAARGFRGILIDRLGFPDRGNALEQELAHRFGKPCTGVDDRYAFFKLTELEKAHAKATRRKEESDKIP